MKTIIFVFLFSLLSITSAHSLTGNKWLSQCETKSENVANWSFEYGICVGYLDALRTVNTVINNTGIYFKKDDYYKKSIAQQTYRSLISLGLFKYVNISFDTLTENKLVGNIELTPSFPFEY